MKRVAILTVAAVLSLTADAWAFNRNISGTWRESDGTQWFVVQGGSSCGFTTSIRTETTGLISFNFSGFISDNGGDDNFSYSGMMEPKTVRSRGKSCRITGSMRAAGDVAGEFGGRVIHMDSCVLTFTASCGVDESKSVSQDCSGTWM